MSTANFVGKNLGLAKMIFTLDIVPLIENTGFAKIAFMILKKCFNGKLKIICS